MRRAALQNIEFDRFTFYAERFDEIFQNAADSAELRVPEIIRRGSVFADVRSVRVAYSLRNRDDAFLFFVNHAFYVR